MSSEINYEKNDVDILEVNIIDLDKSKNKEIYWDMCCRRFAYFSIFIVICFVVGYFIYKLYLNI